MKEYKISNYIHSSFSRMDKYSKDPRMAVEIADKHFPESENYFN